MRVVTWNVENLFTPSTTGEPDRPSQEVYAAKLRTLTDVVARLDPQVLALQEVGDERALDDLRETLESATAGGWVSRCSREPDGRGIRVAFLTTLDVLETDDVTALPPGLAPVQVDDAGRTTDRMGRGALRIRVQGGLGPVDVVTAHLKSKLLSYPGGRFAPRDEVERARAGAFALFRRAAEAAALRVAVDDVLRGRGREQAVVVCGDLNDTVEAATTQLLQGPGGSELGTAGALVPDQGDAHRLWNVAPLIDDHRRFSRVYRGRGELIDHVLVSRALLERVQLADSAVDATGAPLDSVTEDPRPRVRTPGSDHAPVLVDLDW
ncbi:endonuclease/exonuclease/phosphatase family protein [Jannaschia sp. R86511]|uniref:endonuclease/exonuclease/phosphatase family protein n=1 Tax=Jannaschia sp. R86511 TaxID=3093853 RepID=UPI0036D339EB